MGAEDRARAEVVRLRALLDQPAPEPSPIEEADRYDDQRDGALLASILDAALPAQAARSRPPWPIRRSKWVALGLGIAACVALVLVVVVPLIGRAPHASAAQPAMLHYEQGTIEQVLDGRLPAASLALKVIASSAVTGQDSVADGSVQFVESYNWYYDESLSSASPSPTLTPTFQRTWLGLDGSFRSAEARSGSFAPSSGLIEPPAAGTEPEVSGDDLGPATFDARLLETLPRDSVALRAALLSAAAGMDCAGDRAAACLGSVITDLSSRYVVPADLRAAFCAVLATEQSIRDLGGVTDRLGRSGHAFAYLAGNDGGPARVSVMIFDPRNGELLATEDVVEGGAGRDLIITQLRVFAQRSWVGALGDVPA